MNETMTPYAMACNGDLDRLSKLTPDCPETGYKWFLVAVDQGHDDAHEYLSDIVEHYNEFRYDDGSLPGIVHLELAEDYLRGNHNIEKSIKLALEHLEEFLHIDILPEGRESALNDLTCGIDGKDRAILDEFISGYPFRHVKWRVDRLVRFKEIADEGADVPYVLIDAEVNSLHEAVDALRPLLTR